LKTVGAIIPDQSKLLIQGARSKVGSKGEISDETLKKIKTVIDSLKASVN
jgi:hypothetical protein